MLMYFRRLAVVGLVILIVATLIACQSSNNKDEFSEKSKIIAQQVNQLKDEVGVTLVGYAADPKMNMFKIGIGYDSTMTKTRLKQIIEALLSGSASTIQESDWHQELKPYNIIIERIGEVKTDFPVIAHKDKGETNLTWDIEESE